MKSMIQSLVSMTVILATVALFSLTAAAEPVGSEISYQGRLKDQTAVAQGEDDFEIKAFDYARNPTRYHTDPG